VPDAWLRQPPLPKALRGFGMNDPVAKERSTFSAAILTSIDIVGAIFVLAPYILWGVIVASGLIASGSGLGLLVFGPVYAVGFYAIWAAIFGVFPVAATTAICLAPFIALYVAGDTAKKVLFFSDYWVITIWALFSAFHILSFVFIRVRDYLNARSAT